MKYTLGVFGSAVDESHGSMRLAAELGQAIASYSDKLILANGACPGIPLEAAKAARRAKSRKITIIGYSPELSQKEAVEYSKGGAGLYDKLYLLPKTLPFLDDPMVRKKFRNVFLTANCDAGIVVAGRWGTMNEFTNMHDMGKVIGVLTGTGGVSDALPGLYKKIHKPSKALVFFDDSPKDLVAVILQELEKRN